MEKGEERREVEGRGKEGGREVEKGEGRREREEGREKKGGRERRKEEVKQLKTS